MLDMKSMGKVAALLKNKDKIKQAAEDTKAHLEALRVEGEAGGGAVRVTVSGAMRVESVRIDPAVATGLAGSPDDRAMAEALVTHATNDALARAQEAAKQAIERTAQDLGLGDLGDLGDLGGLRNLLP
jgi:DNA-binding YbaB/EbfC family protein